MKTQSPLLFSAGLMVLSISCLRAVESPQAVSRTSRVSASAAGNSFLPAFSADGRYVVFLSHANNLVTNDDLAPYLDVFVRDLVAGKTTLASVNTSGTGGGDADAGYPSISSNGQFVAFASAAGNLVDNDTNGFSDIFLRDLIAGTTTLVSVNVGGTGSGNGGSSNPTITPDGRWVVFESAASNLVADDTNEITDVFLRDLQNGMTFLVSTGAQRALYVYRSDSPSISADGSRVAFASTAQFFPTNLTNSAGEIFARDFGSGALIWVSRNVADYFVGLTNYHRCFNPLISADGRFVAYKATNPEATNLVLLLHHDLQTGNSTLITSNSLAASWPEISTDGRFVAYDALTNVFVWDRQTGSSVLVSVNASGAGPGNGASRTPVMTPAGSKVVFLSAATNLVSNPVNGLFQLYVRDLALGTTSLINWDRLGRGNSTDLELILPAISANGKLAAFETADDRLRPEDFNQASDVFVDDLISHNAELVSRAITSLPAATGVGLCSLGTNAVSADGRFVVFTGFDNNFVAGDTNGWQDVFVRDRFSGTTVPVSTDTNGGFRRDWRSRDPVISGNGRFVAFARQTNAAGSDGTRFAGTALYRRDLQTGTTVLVNDRQLTSGFTDLNAIYPMAMSFDGQLIAFQALSDLSFTLDVYLRDMIAGTDQRINLSLTWDATDPLLSPDSRWVLFQSRGQNVPTNATSGIPSLFGWDRMSNSRTLVSIGPDGSTRWGCAGGGVISANSRFVAFVSLSSAVTVFDLETRISTVVCSNCTNPSITGDGRTVVFETLPFGTTPRDIVAKDLQSGTTVLISVNRLGTGGGNGNSTAPLASANGRYVVFASKASDLVDNDANQASDIFVRDRWLGTTLLVSTSRKGNMAGNGASSKPVLSADGRTLVFQSFASDLVDGDYNDTGDVFVRRLNTGDTDGDGLDDDWEAAYFQDLSRDGTGDFDGDGQSDLQEFIAGTDPTNGGSILRVMTMTALSGGGTTLLWSAVPGKTYRVQFKDNLADEHWTDLPGQITADGSTASHLDLSASLAYQRFYRVLVVN